MKPCVIAYFPGAGGNRLARYLLGLEWQHNHAGHSHSGPNPAPEINYSDVDTRPYPVDSTSITQRSNLIELTHCLDTQLLLQHFPGRQIIKLKSHFPASYNRCWQVWTQYLHQDEIRQHGQERTMNMALEHHWKYYTETGVDWWADTVYDVDDQTNDFCQFMHHTIAQYQSTAFAQYQKNWQRLHQRDLNFGY